MALTQKQEAFCLAYIETGNASEAYRRAYDTARMKPESVNRLAKALMDNVKIRSRLAELHAPALEKAGATVEYIVSNLVEVVERCMQRAPVLDMKGEHVTDDEGNYLWKFDSKGVNTALQTLARYRGMLTDKVQVDLNITPKTILDMIEARRDGNAE